MQEVLGLSGCSVNTLALLSPAPKQRFTSVRGEAHPAQAAVSPCACDTHPWHCGSGHSAMSPKSPRLTHGVWLWSLWPAPIPGREENRRSLEKRYGLAGGGRTVKNSKKAEGENRQGAVTPGVAWRRKTPQKLKTRAVPQARVSL